MAEGSGGGGTGGTGRSVCSRFLRKVPLWLVLIVLIAFSASNLLLISPWGRGMAERELERRTGLPWKAGFMTWSPWNGLTLRNARVFLPGDDQQPVVAVAGIGIKPYWKPLVRGDLRLREVSLNQPHLELALEMLAAAPADAQELDMEAPPPPPELAAGAPQLAPPKPEAQTSLLDYAQVADQPKIGPQVLAQAKPPAVNGSVPPAKPRPAAGLSTRLRVKDASIRLFSSSKDMDLLRVKALSMDLPVAGEDAEGTIKVAGLSIPGMDALPDLEQVVVWKRPRLEIEETELDLGGVKLQMRVQLGVQTPNSSLPFLVDMAVRPQQVESISWLEQKSMHASAKIVAARFRLLGLIDEPMRWKAEGIAFGEGITVQAGRGRPRVTFDTMYVPAILHQGKLYCMGFKMIGEDLSVMGNGRLSMKGGIIGITRLVASPEVAEVMEKSLQRAGLAENWWWYNLGTPDRKVRDLLISGSIFNPSIDAGPSHASLPLGHLIHLIMHPGGKGPRPGGGPAAVPADAETIPAENHNENDENH